MTPARPARSAIPRFGIVVAAVIGFGVGATGFAAAQHDDPPEPVEPPAASPAPTTTVDDGPTTTVDDGPTTTVDDRPTTTVDDRPATRMDDGPTTTVDDTPTTTIDDRRATTPDDSPTTTLDDSPTTTIDDSPTTTVDDSPSAAGLPAPFTTSYASAGGSISVSWSGTALTLDGVTPAPGFRAEIEHQSWDRVRVDFEGDDRDARIEVRISDGQLRVGID